VNRFRAWKTGERSPTHASLDVEPCDDHGGDVLDQYYLEAWEHDPQRPDAWTLSA